MLRIRPEHDVLGVFGHQPEVRLRLPQLLFRAHLLVDVLQDHHQVLDLTVGVADHGDPRLCPQEGAIGALHAAAMPDAVRAAGDLVVEDGHVAVLILRNGQPELGPDDGRRIEPEDALQRGGGPQNRRVR